MLKIIPTPPRRFLGSVSHPVIRSPGTGRTPGDHASLLGATVSLQCGQAHSVSPPADPILNPPRDEGSPSLLRPEPAKFLGNANVRDVLDSHNTCSNHDGKSTSGCSSDQLRHLSGTGAQRCSTEVCMKACVQSESEGCVSTHESSTREYAAVLGVTKREFQGHPVLYIRVSPNLKYAQYVGAYSVFTS